MIQRQHSGETDAESHNFEFSASFRIISHLLPKCGYNTIIPWLLSDARDNARTEGEGERGTKLSQVYYVL